MYNVWIKTALFISIELFTSVALAQEQGTFTDVRDGTTYKTVQIGKKT